MTSRNTTARALARFALVAAAAIAAASLWAGSRPEQGLLLDAQTWEEEVQTASTGPWPAEGWYRLEPRERGIDVSPVRPGEAGEVPANALFFRLRGTALKTGLRASYRHMEVLAQPRLGRDHELSLGRTRFSIRVEETPVGIEYAIGYGGQTYTYVLAPVGASTSVVDVADLDGDSRPDFLVEVEDNTTYLLLSTQARPGMNLPTAELPAHGC
ncbi:MAG TPA: hypothetical protein VGD76_15230 [Ramlibacter sp.]